MRKEEREDIIEELAMVLCHIDGLYWNDLTLTEVSDYKKKTELVCLKVDRELPSAPYSEPGMCYVIEGQEATIVSDNINLPYLKWGVACGIDKMLKWHNESLESLIKEGK